MNEESLFHDAKAKPPAERVTFLDTACAGQPELRAAVETLLASSEDPGDFVILPPGALYYLGDVVRTLGRPTEAREDYERAIAIHEKLVKENPSPWYRSLLAHSLRRRRLALGKLGDLAGCAADTRRALGLYDGLKSRSSEEWFETANCHAALAGLAGLSGSGVSAAEADELSTQAMSFLRKAVGTGYRNVGAFRTESALDPLRDREDFHLLAMDLAVPAQPFAWDKGESP